MCKLNRFSFEIIVEMFFQNLYIVIGSTLPTLSPTSYMMIKHPVLYQEIVPASVSSGMSHFTSSSSDPRLWYLCMMHRLKDSVHFVQMILFFNQGVKNLIPSWHTLQMHSTFALFFALFLQNTVQPRFMILSSCLELSACKNLDNSFVMKNSFFISVDCVISYSVGKAPLSRPQQD